MITRFIKERHLPKTYVPDPPKVELTANYGYVKIVDQLTLEDLLGKLSPIESQEFKHMEDIGQNFGFILYRMWSKKFKQMKITGQTSLTHNKGNNFISY